MAQSISETEYRSGRPRQDSETVYPKAHGAHSWYLVLHHTAARLGLER
jgi:hypothetical protein